MKKYKIGITFNLEGNVTDIWANGANQNVIHLCHLFQHSELIDEVVLVSWVPGGLKNVLPLLKDSCLTK